MAGFPAALTLLGVVLAVWQTEATYHNALLLLAGLSAAEAPGSHLRDAQGTLLGLVIAGGAALIIRLMGGLCGPSIEPFSSVVEETVVHAVVGASAGGLWSQVSASP